MVEEELERGMSLILPKSLCADIQVPDAQVDYREATRIAQFRVSDKAIYLPAFPGVQYLPFAGLTAVVLRNASLSTIGCCGKELPVLKLTLHWCGGEKELVIDPPKHADTILNRIRAACPQLDISDRR